MRLDPATLDLLQELVYARGPCGQEDEVRSICTRELRRLADRVWTDEAGNVVGILRGRPSRRAATASAIRIMAHMDELALIVKRIDPDGAIRVANICTVGGMRPGFFGQGPVEVLADSGIVPGVLSLGPQHTSPETAHMEATKTKPLEWPQFHVFTNKTAAELARLGVHAGTRVVLARERRKLFAMDGCLAGYFMDDRAAITALLLAAAQMRAARQALPQDVYLVMTSEEERGGVGAAYAARTLPGDITVAVEVGPVAAEYGTAFCDDPIIGYGDTRSLYSRSLADALRAHARRLGQHPQCAYRENLGTDASISKAYGQTGRAAMVSIPTHNTHGYEIIPPNGLRTCALLLAAFAGRPDGPAPDARKAPGATHGRRKAGSA
jgi:putative aminopeptidase FrvX